MATLTPDIALTKTAYLLEEALRKIYPGLDPTMPELAEVGLELNDDLYVLLAVNPNHLWRPSLIDMNFSHTISHDSRELFQRFYQYENAPITLHDDLDLLCQQTVQTLRDDVVQAQLWDETGD